MISMDKGMNTKTNVKITIYGRNATITGILYNLGLYEALDSQGRKFFIDENAEIEIDGIKMRAFDAATLNYCESVGAISDLEG